MIHQSAYILQPKQKKKKVEKKEKKEMKKEVKKEVKKEEKSSSSTKGPGGEHMFQVSTCIATDSLRLLRTRRGETREKYISGSSSYVNNWINTVNVEKFVWWKSSHK